MAKIAPQLPIEVDSETGVWTSDALPMLYVPRHFFVNNHIGIGTDFTQGHGQDFFEMLTHDKGYARRLTSFGKIINPLGIRTVGEFPNLTETLLKRGHPERVVRKIMGENWVNVLKDVWGE